MNDVDEGVDYMRWYSRQVHSVVVVVVVVVVDVDEIYWIRYD